MHSLNEQDLVPSQNPDWKHHRIAAWRRSAP